MVGNEDDDEDEDEEDEDEEDEDDDDDEEDDLLLSSTTSECLFWQSVNDLLPTADTTFDQSTASVVPWPYLKAAVINFSTSSSDHGFDKILNLRMAGLTTSTTPSIS